ncbi:hypothetical protein O181_089818 [Austropuccinia psidii MF-1]|uniref:Uncharacterized protein n=1 Tax=Austropuccinia psidii MF-1 TaxID=1389203 RepID=A0A9Q3IU08_9BASI|nr:hypothetical protein [Austropuccinia psidii MF-1]
MVHKRKGSDSSVQPDGSRQGSGENRARTGRPSSRKTHLEDARVAPHPPRYLPTTFDIDSEDKLIQGNGLRVEPLPSGSHGNISALVQTLVQSIQGGRMGNMSKPLAGGH